MEADWEVEIGPEAHIIDAIWPGFIDLRRTPERIEEIEEAWQFPMLAEALLRMNSLDSWLWTSKCDLWTLDKNREHWDPDEMNATHGECLAALACYIDVLPNEASVFAGVEGAASWARTTISRLREIDCRCCRMDIVIRRAFQRDIEGLGVTAYVIGCGPDPQAARVALGGALAALMDAVSVATNDSSKISGALQ